LLGAWVNADAATDFTALVDFESFKSFEALLATDFEVFSFLDITLIFFEVLVF